MSQSTRVEKSSPYTRVSVCVGSFGSATVRVLRPSINTSVTRKLLRKFHRPRRIGVPRLNVVVRLSEKSESSCGIPSMGGNGIVPAGELSVWFTTNENCGDQVMSEPILMGMGVRLIFGNVCVIRSLLISWLRLPPMDKVPQSSRLEKLMELRN